MTIRVANPKSGTIQKLGTQRDYAICSHCGRTIERCGWIWQHWSNLKERCEP